MKSDDSRTGKKNGKLEFLQENWPPLVEVFFDTRSDGQKTSGRDRLTGINNPLPVKQGGMAFDQAQY